MGGERPSESAAQHAAALAAQRARAADEKAQLAASLIEQRDALKRELRGAEAASAAAATRATALASDVARLKASEATLSEARLEARLELAELRVRLGAGTQPRPPRTLPLSLSLSFSLPTPCDHAAQHWNSPHPNSPTHSLTNRTPWRLGMRRARRSLNSKASM